LVPGDSFASRTLLPDDEIMKRLKPDEEDMAKGIIASMSIAKKSDDETPGAAKKQQKDKPVFN
jgi:hypothetical protein